MVRLSRDDIRFFQREGYVIKRKVLDPALMARARERLWIGAPPPLDRQRPETWTGPFREPCLDEQSHRQGFVWKFREPGSEPWMVRLLATNPSVWTMAEQLLGEGSLKTPERIRGIYCVLPEGDAPEWPTTCHVDAHPFHLGVVGYIDDVPPNGGGFTVWPGSHRTFYYDFRSQYKLDPTEQYERDRAFFNQQPYVDGCGEAGDIIFWHHRLGHSVGHNRSTRIRQAVLYDFVKQDLNVDEPPCEDMWRDWPGVRAVVEEAHPGKPLLQPGAV